MKAKYKTEIYYATTLFVVFLLGLLSILALMVIVGRMLHAPGVIGGILFACLCIIPFVFENKIKGLFTKKVSLNFSELFFSISQYHLKDDVVSTILR